MSEDTIALPEPPLASGPSSGRRSWGLVAVVATVVAVVLVAAGGFAAWRFLYGGGPRPAEVLPASTFALVTVDLNPSGGQKVDAIKTLRKFPSFREKTGLTPDADPLRRIFEAAQKQGTCTSLDYDRDVKPWVGQRAGFGGVVLDDKPVPVLALQVSDHDRARADFRRLATCAHLDQDDQFGWTLTEDYVVVSDSTAHAKAIVAQGARTPLSDDADFQKWTDQAGGAGIVNAYVGRQAVDVASEELGSSGGLFGSTLAGSSDQGQVADALAAYKNFKGAAAVLRFNDGGIELSAAGSAGRAGLGHQTVADHVAAMPRDTALLLAIAVPHSAFAALEKADPKSSDLLGGMLGIDIPGDLETLLGSSLSISLGGPAPHDLTSISGPGDLSVGALIHGDSTRIDAVIAKLEKSAGSSLEDLHVAKESKDGRVAIASNQQYADQLLGHGTLSDEKSFKDAVPHAKDAAMIAYADLDGDWGKALVDQVRKAGDQGSTELADNLAVVRAFGASAWTDDDVSHGLIRLSLK